MTENEKLRTLLMEAQSGLMCDRYREAWERCDCVVCAVKTRIDAALAEPVEPSESEYAMHARIRADYDKTVADCWRAKVAEVERERDEARALRTVEAEKARHEAALLKMRLSDLKHALGIDAAGWFDRFKRAERERDEARAEVAAAYQRGAEATREAAAQVVEDADDGVPLQCLADAGIRALPLPEDRCAD